MEVQAAGEDSAANNLQSMAVAHQQTAIVTTTQTQRSAFAAVAAGPGRVLRVAAAEGIADVRAMAGTVVLNDIHLVAARSRMLVKKGHIVIAKLTAEGQCAEVVVRKEVVSAVVVVVADTVVVVIAWDSPPEPSER
jgi:hypothetical protein